jgi:hypothetical protein
VRYGGGGGTHVIKMFDNIIISFLYDALEKLFGSASQPILSLEVLLFTRKAPWSQCRLLIL